jgi:hypothetical protein
MPNAPQFEVNYGNLAVSPPVGRADPNAPLYASVDGVVAPLSQQEVIFQTKQGGEAHVMTFQVLQALDQCREFRTLDEHIARILTSIPALSNQRDSMQRVLDSLIKRGLLRSEADFIGSFGRAAARVQAPMRGVFIRACDRPVQLERLLLTLTDGERRHRSNQHYIVLDDSTDDRHSDRHRDLLREFARNTGCKVGHVGRAERARLLERLQRGVPQAKSSLEWLLSRGPRTRRAGGGRNWNLALLLSAGARLCLLDDDFRLPLKQRLATAGLNPDPNATATASFYRNIEEALGAGTELAADPFALHAEACGQALGALSNTPNYALERNSLRGLHLGRLAHLQPDARVIATLNGTYGSSGTETGLWLYQLDGESRAEFWADRESYLRNVEAQNLWYGTDQARVSSIAHFTPFALDNSALLPCTNPDGRGEDGLFSVVANFCHPDALILHLPMAIGHVQESERKRSTLTLQAHTPRFNHFLRDYVQRQLGLYKAEDPGQRMGLLAEVLRDLAGASVRERVEHLREYLGYTRADVIERLQHQLEAADKPPLYWEADVRAIVTANGKALLTKAPPRLQDWSDEIDDHGCAKALADELNDLADAYTVWPALWRHANEQGDKLLAAI